ncbi:MAG TPA: HlyC/CorC family transporter [Dehalococcoidia bacterium]|nr:HlyC/CorC family transporter [Dehalococcoidia bacterium]
MPNLELYIALLVICLVLSAFFSGSETAFISLQRFRLEYLVSSDVKNAKKVARLVEKPEKFLSIVLFGNTLVNAAAAALATAIAVHYWGEQNGIIIATVVLTVILLIFCEATPKTLAARHAERLSLLLHRPIQIVSWLFTPFVIALSWLATASTRIVGGKLVPLSIISDEEIRTMISVGHKEGTVEEAEARMLHKVFDFGDRPVHEIMVPRLEVHALQQGSTVADFLKLYMEAPISRYLVYQENMDNVVGTLAVKDVLMARARGTITEESTIDDLVRPAYFTPETNLINKLFFDMRDHNYRMAVVIDEYGGTAGIVSLSRLVEEIVGQVGDEMAGIEKDYEIINENTYQIDGGMRVSQANEEMDLKLPEGEDYETVAGFILSLLGHIPRRNEQLRYHGLKMVITEMKGQKIEKILLTNERRANSGQLRK